MLAIGFVQSVMHKIGKTQNFVPPAVHKRNKYRLAKATAGFAENVMHEMITVQNIVQIAVRQKKNRKRKRKKLGLSILARNAEEHSR